MRIVLQRVSQASVKVDGKVISAISKGLLVFIGIEKGDASEQAEEYAAKISRLRIFSDKQGKMNLSLQEVCGEILVVSQFTLVGDLRKGNRPSFDSSEKPEQAKELIANFVEALRLTGLQVREGEFGAMMDVSLINDGPVTFIMGSEK